MIKNCKLGKNIIFENKKTIFLQNCIIGDNTFIGAYSKIVNAYIGNDCRIYSFTNLYGPNLTINNHCKVGACVEITNDVFIGEDSVISSHTFICSGVILEGKNFIGHSCAFTNDRNPLPYNPDFKLEKTLIKYGAVIGTGSTLLPVIIGKYATIGMGSVVTKDIPDYAIAYGDKIKAIPMKIKPHKNE